MESCWGVGIKFNELLTSTPDKASVTFHSPFPLLSKKEPSEITKQGIEIFTVAYRKHIYTLTV